MRDGCTLENGQIIKDIGPYSFQNNMVALYVSVPTT